MMIAQYSLSALLLLATVIDAINTSHSETMSPHGQVQAAVLADGDTHVSLMRKENTSQISEDDTLETAACECTDVDLKGKKWSPGGLKKCVGQCKKVHKTNEPNDCPKDWKIISPQNKEDWKTLIALNVIPEVSKPQLLIDVSQDKNGCGGCTKTAMNSDEPGQSMWKTLDGSDWYIRSAPFYEPNGDYHAHCFLRYWNFENIDDLRVNDHNCAYYSHAYLCQPDIRYTTTTTEAKSEAASQNIAGLLGFAFLALQWI